MTSGTKDAQLEGSCHCGAIKITLPELPKNLNECRCSLCFRYGVLWSYHPRDKVFVKQASPTSTSAYIWSTRNTEFHHCNECGCVTHWYKVDKSDPAALMGVNCRMLKKETTTAIPWVVTTGPELDHLFVDGDVYHLDSWERK